MTPAAWVERLLTNPSSFNKICNNPGYLSTSSKNGFTGLRPSSSFP